MHILIDYGCNAWALVARIGNSAGSGCKDWEQCWFWLQGLQTLQGPVAWIRNIVGPNYKDFEQ